MPIAIINPDRIFLPVLVVVALTFAAFINLAMRRQAALKAGQDPAYYRAHIGPPEPETVIAASRHYDNLFELPVLFYAACFIAFALGEVTDALLVWAWFYASARTVQSVVHMTYNNPLHRGAAFALGMFALMAMWIDVGWTVSAML